MKRIVIKMRSFKKLYGGELLQLALLLSLMKVDPENYLGYSPHSPLEPGGDVSLGHSWAQTQAMFHDMGIGDGMSPRIHPKSMDTLLEQHQAEILEDLNSLGRYSRLSQYAGVPVHISAYIVDTATGEESPGPCRESEDNDGTDSDSGISDTNHDSDHEDAEKEKQCEDMEDMECETILDNVAAPGDVLGLDAIVGLTPPPEQEMLDYSGQDALEAELVHIDEQLMHIEDDLGHIDEQFIMMDQQLAETISDDSIYENEMFTPNVAASSVNIENIDIGESNPFDDWQREALADMEDLVLDNIDSNGVRIPHARVLNGIPELPAIKEEEEKQDDTFLQDPDLFPTEQSQSGSALLEDFDEDLLGQGKMSARSDMEKIVKQDVVLPQMSSLQTNASQPFKTVASSSLLDHQEAETESVFNVTESESASKESSVDRDFMEEINVEDQIDQNDEDIIMQVLRESNINFEDIPIDIEGLKLEEEIKVEDIKEEVVEVEDFGYEVSIVDGASAKTEIDYDRLHSDIKSRFQESEDGYSFAEFTLGSQFSDAYNPGFNHLAYEHDHSYGGAPKLEPSLLEEPSTSRRRNISESSGYSSMTEEMTRSESSARCRDEILARKMKLPFKVADIINSPVDSFNELLTRPGLSPEQIKVCHDIRRRGKNKVAARNCRKRKMDTIDELQSQVDQVRRRREELLRAREELEAERARWSSKLSYLEETVLTGIGKELGMFTLEVTGAGVTVTARTLVGGAGRYSGQERGGRSS